ncbi:hypothetical protein NKI50_27565 [Mesorhizobium sp. M0563]|uniref:hypothetical protein n=1 Tax=unclassified Mesorhizobium TaxID=325217 RepID=UPI003335A054
MSSPNVVVWVLFLVSLATRAALLAAKAYDMPAGFIQVLEEIDRLVEMLHTIAEILAHIAE